MKRIDIRLAGGIIVAGALVLAGNASSRTPAQPAASYREVTCPPDVTRNAQMTARCGFLTVPENRTKPDGRTIQLFVVRERPSGPLRPDPVLALHELGSTRAWTGRDDLPPRVHREVITVDHRGLGQSTPSLACPEVERREDSFSHGAYFSTVCHDQLPFVSQAALVALTRGAPAYREAFADSPFRGICDRWDVGQAGLDVRTPVISNVPVLIFVGRFDPYGSPALARQAARTLKRSWLVELPNKGYNGLAGSYCALAARNAWIDKPSSPPKTSCLKGLRIRFLLG
jgi:pimeloyl-ACP methyl ester carboxylesterase